MPTFMLVPQTERFFLNIDLICRAIEGDSNFWKFTTPNLGGIILDVINCRLQQFIPVPLPGSVFQ